MRSRSFHVLVFGATLIAAGAETPARAQHPWFGPRAYTTPVETAYVLPTAYVVPSAYVTPTSTVYATAYWTSAYNVAPTAYYSPTAYYAPTYYRTGLFGRRRYYTPTVYSPTVYSPTVYSPTVASYFPTTTYTPTTYYQPSSYVTTSAVVPTAYEDVPVVASTAVGCSDVAVATVRTTPRETAPVTRRQRAAEGDRPQSAVESTPTASTEMTPAPPTPGSAASGNRNDDLAPPQPLDNAATPSPPAAMKPAPDAEKSSLPIPPAGAKPKTVAPPVAPSGSEPPLSLPLEPGGTVYRDVRKPSNLYALRPTANRPLENLLLGKVVSRDGGAVEEDVQITVSNRLQKYVDRVGKSDALGRFAFRLPDGDWSVKVTMPSGRSYPVSDLTVSGGKIFDAASGVDVPSLIIEK